MYVMDEVMKTWSQASCPEGKLCKVTNNAVLLSVISLNINGLIYLIEMLGYEIRFHGIISAQLFFCCGI